MKLCLACGVSKQETDFYRQGTGLRARCIACYVEINRDQGVKHAEKRRAYDAARGPGWERSGRERWAISEADKWAKYVRRVYGVTADWISGLLRSQAGVCAICRKHCNRSTSRRLCVDHDHGSGAVRGLLCFKCNTGLGRFNDNPLLLEEAAAYVRRGSPGRIALYLSGPMTGVPGSNYSAFNAEAARLRALGYLVENPAENTAPAGTTWEQYMRLAVLQLVRCEMVAMLPGWKTSRGASIERHLALDLGMPIFNAGEITIPCGGRCAA